MNKQTLTVIVTTIITVILVLVVVALLMPSLGPRYLHPLMMGSQPVAADLDLSTAHLSDNGVFMAAWSSNPAAPPLSKVHTWTVHVESTDGQPVEGASITVDGGMPQHGHGLPTSPQVTRDLGNGDYLVEGMKFQMPGWWQVRFHISAGAQTDTITFNLTLQ
jgi:hypothetical protein